VSGLVRRALAAVSGWLSWAAAAVAGAVRVVVRTARTVTVRVIGAVSTALAGIRQRHRERLARDAGYRTALATGLSALLVTVTPQPAVAAALAVLVSEHLGSPRQPVGASYNHEPDDEDGYDDYDTRRAWSTPSPSRSPQRLWDGWRG
jgi:hypothetical protein